MKKILVTAIMLCSSFFAANAQFEASEQKAFSFRHLDFGISAGTTGLGFDLALPFHEQFRVRAGFSFIPRFDKTVNFGIDGSGQYEDESFFLDNFNKITENISDLTGLNIKNNVDMIATSSFNNGHLLVDFYPIKKNAFKVTAGFYWGRSKIASACNSTEDMSTLLGASMYNKLYEKVENYEPIFGDPAQGTDIYLDPELEMTILDIGRLGFHVGDRVEDGKAYMMEPDENSTVKVNVFANSFKPYLGVGYGGKLTNKPNAPMLEFDAGMLFWGGSPRIITHEGVDLARDVENIGGKVGRYVNFMKAIKVYPVLNLRLSFNLF